MQKNTGSVKSKNNWSKLIEHLNTKNSTFSLAEIALELRGQMNISLIPHYVHTLVSKKYLKNVGTGLYIREKVIPSMTTKGDVFS